MMTPTEMHIDALMEKIEKLEAENARLQEQLRLTQVDNNLLMTENARYREALDKAEKALKFYRREFD